MEWWRVAGLAANHAGYGGDPDTFRPRQNNVNSPHFNLVFDEIPLLFEFDALSTTVDAMLHVLLVLEKLHRIE